MMAQPIYYVYNPCYGLTEAEQTVIHRGFPFVSTTILQRRLVIEFRAFFKNTNHYLSGIAIDRLNDHQHHSRNTHLVVSGSIAVGLARDNEFRLRSTTYGPGGWIDVDANVAYRGEAGDEGCVFVEGHQQLSPTTADRFLRRGTIVMAKESTPGAFTTTS
jgi:hypothetical protein